MDLNPSTQILTLGMSTSGVTGWFPMEKLNTGIDCAWPATGTPIGVISVELTSNPADLTTVVVVSSASMSPAPTQPSGDADRTCWDNIKTCEPYGRVRYVRTSGGASATMTITVNGKF